MSDTTVENAEDGTRSPNLETAAVSLETFDLSNLEAYIDDTEEPDDNNHTLTPNPIMDVEESDTESMEDFEDDNQELANEAEYKGLELESELHGHGQTHNDHDGSCSSGEPNVSSDVPLAEGSIESEIETVEAVPVDTSLNQSIDYELYSVGNEQVDEILLTFFEIFECFTNSNATTLSEIWESYITNQIEPTGWTGIYKTGFKVNRTVMVHDVSPSQMKALVEILDFVEEDPEAEYRDRKIWVPLEKLFISDEENEHGLNLDETAYILYMHRTFRSILQMPWDTKLAYPWYQKVLLPRAQLLADISCGQVPISQVRRILEIIQESRKIYTEIKKMDYEDEHNSGASTASTIGSFEYAEQVYCNLNMKLADLQHEFEKLEKKEIRECMDFMTTQGRFTLKSKILLVVQEGEVNVTVMDKFLHILKFELGETSFKIVNDLRTALNGCDIGSKLYLFPGIYKASGLCLLEGGGSIVGLGCSRSEVKIIPDAGGDIFFFINGHFVMENLTLEINAPDTSDLEGFESIEFLVKELWRAPEVAFHLETGTLRLHDVELVGPAEKMDETIAKDLGKAVLIKYKTRSIRAKCPENVELIKVSIHGFAENNVTKYDSEKGKSDSTNAETIVADDDEDEEEGEIV